MGMPYMGYTDGMMAPMAMPPMGGMGTGGTGTSGGNVSAATSSPQRNELVTKAKTQRLALQW